MCRTRLHGPVVAVIECPNFPLLKSGMRALDDFPCVTIHSNGRDSQYQVTIFSLSISLLVVDFISISFMRCWCILCYKAIGWQVIASKIAMQRCAASSQWLNERVALSRYAHVRLFSFICSRDLQYKFYSCVAKSSGICHLIVVQCTIFFDRFH